MDYAEAVRQANELIQQAVPLLVRNAAGGSNAPDFHKTDTSALDAETARLQVARDVGTANIDIDQQRLSTATAEEKAAIIARGTAEANLAEADRIKSERDAAMYAQYAEIFGLKADDVARTVQRMNTERPIAEAKLRDIQQRQAVSPFDNPLEWWKNQITLPAAIEDYNRQADIINVMKGTLDGYISTANAAATFAYKGLPTITAAQAKATADRAVTDAAAKAAQADINLSKTSVDFHTKRFSMDLAVAQQTATTTQLQVQQNIQEYQARIHAIQFADNHANRLLRAGELLEKLATNEDAMAQRKSIEVILKNYDHVMGHPEGTTNYQIWKITGEPQRNNMVAIGSGSLGATPVQGMYNWYRSNPGPLASKETSRLMEYVREKTEEYMVVAGTQAIDEKQKIDKVNKMVADDLKKDITNASKMGSLFYEMSPGKMLAAAQVSKESPIGKVLEGYAAQEKNIPTELVAQAFANTFKSPNDAGAALADYYKRNIALRNTTLNAKTLGIELPTTYGVKVRLGAFTSAILDLTKPADAIKYVTILQTPAYYSDPADQLRQKQGTK